MDTYYTEFWDIYSFSKDKDASNSSTYMYMREIIILELRILLSVLYLDIYVL